MLEPILAVIGGRKLRELTADDVRQVLSAMADGYSTAAVTMGHLALKRVIRPAEASDLVSRNVAAQVDTPKGREGRPSRSLTLEQAVAVITAAQTLPAMELCPGHLGAALNAGNVRKMFKRACTMAGIGDGWTPRELRTSFVSLMSRRGVSIEEIARLAGHGSTGTTEVVYRRDLRPVITTGTEILDEIFGPGTVLPTAAICHPSCGYVPIFPKFTG